MTKDTAQSVSYIKMFDHIRLKHDGGYIDGKVVGFSMDRRRIVVSYFTDGMDTKKDSPLTKVLNADDVIETLPGLYELREK